MFIDQALQEQRASCWDPANNTQAGPEDAEEIPPMTRHRGVNQKPWLSLFGRVGGSLAMGTGPVLGLNLITWGKTCPGSVIFSVMLWDEV